MRAVCAVGATVSGRQDDFGGDGIIFYMNGQSLDALAFRVVNGHHPQSLHGFTSVGMDDLRSIKFPP